MGLSAPTEVVHLSPDVVAISSRQSGFYNQLVKKEKFFFPFFFHGGALLAPWLMVVMRRLKDLPDDGWFSIDLVTE